MKILIAILLLFGLNSCKPVYLPYRSTASNERYTVSTPSELTNILGNPDKANMRSYSVLSGVDYNPSGEKTYYILVAPSDGDSFEHVGIWVSASILPQDAKSMITALDKIALEWDSPMKTQDGHFYRFITRVKMPVPVPFFPDPSGWVPSIELTCNRTARGSYATLLIGDESWQLRYKFVEKDEIEDFRELLSLALADLQKKGML